MACSVADRIQLYMFLDELLHVQQHQLNNNDNDSHESSRDDESNTSKNDNFSDDINDIMTI